jgi:hypothetical protein
MLRIDAARRSPLEQLAVDYFYTEKSAHPSIDFCQRVFGVPEDDEKIAKRLSVAVSTVRSWRELGRRAKSWGCW